MHCATAISPKEIAAHTGGHHPNTNALQHSSAQSALPLFSAALQNTLNEHSSIARLAVTQAHCKPVSQSNFVQWGIFFSIEQWCCATVLSHCTPFLTALF